MYKKTLTTLALILLLAPQLASAQAGQFIPFLRSTASTSTRATTTTLFSTTASSTNLFGQLINGFNLSTCDATTGKLTWASGSFGCGTDFNTGGSGTFSWTPTSYGVSTSTTLGFLNGFLSTASSTINSAFRLPTLSQGFAYIGTGGLVGTTASSSINLSWLNNDAGFLTGNQTITLSGDVSGSGATSITTLLGLEKVFGKHLATSTAIANGELISYVSATDDFGGLTCAEITGSADLCDASDATGAGSTFPFTPTSYGVSTSTIIGFNGLFSTASSTFSSTFHLPSLSSGGLGVNATGLVYSGATTTAGTGLTYSGNAFNVDLGTAIDISAETNLGATWPVILTGDTLSFGGLSTSSAPTTGQMPYWTGVNTFGSVATGTISVPTGLTITANRSAVGGAAVIGLDTGYVIPLQSTLDAKAEDATTLTIAGTANQITSSAGAQDLSANRDECTFSSPFLSALNSSLSCYV